MQGVLNAADCRVLCTTAALKESQTVEAWGAGAAAGLAAIQRYGGARPGDRTMLDAFTPAVKLFQQKLSEGERSHKGCHTLCCQQVYMLVELH